LKVPVQKEDLQMLHRLLKLFLLDQVSQNKLKKIYKNSSKEKIIHALKSYKQEKTRENF
jgi:hypothetical protein